MTNTMDYDTRQDFIDCQLRRFLTVLFVTRARRHLATLATLYGWTEEQKAEYDERFIKITDSHE
jgi:hypothetical protein